MSTQKELTRYIIGYSKIVERKRDGDGNDQQEADRRAAGRLIKADRRVKHCKKDEMEEAEHEHLATVLAKRRPDNWRLGKRTRKRART